MNWFKPTDNTIVSFSGGRTSAMMLKLILDAFGGVLPDWVKVVFCNTGEEREETLNFVNECSIRWNVPIIWLEYKTAEKPKDRWHVVSYETASRNGEPFEALIKQKKYLPNPVKRFCTIELKIRCAKRYAQSVLKWKHWDVAIGFRADEPNRTAKLSLPNKEPFERFAPLASIGVTAKDVGDFWNQQGFDLELPNMNGKTMHGNCKLCFLKGAQTTLRLIAENPETADWYIKQEQSIQSSGQSKGAGARFRKDRPSYSQMKIIATSQIDFIGFPDDAISCIECGDL
jgi:3'-phosphoadenosine 5'-phosphosulfate sulfotransferase (PAPS reductase)/FAD synthetase